MSHFHWSLFDLREGRFNSLVMVHGRLPGFAAQAVWVVLAFGFWFLVFALASAIC
jgi:hypothetical protein